ncbi:MAG: histidine kinase dimerization/phospho-acceptor domain-containing protein [Rhodothermia bacterium]|nr:MAG: histidine kinase dimerization/phospho-acceptor domain-containing protein [Rhodothermia bacterium]
MDTVEMTRDESEKIHATLRTVRKHLSRIHHDMNNPLSIISGNVQLLDELSKALQVSDEFEAPLKDVMAASEQLTGMTEELVVLRNLLAQLDEEES